MMPNILITIINLAWPFCGSIPAFQEGHGDSMAPQGRKGQQKQTDQCAEGNPTKGKAKSLARGRGTN